MKKVSTCCEGKNSSKICMCTCIKHYYGVKKKFMTVFREKKFFLRTHVNDKKIKQNVNECLFFCIKHGKSLSEATDFGSIKKIKKK